MLNVSEIASSAEERVLSGVKVGQAMVIDGLKNTVAFADRIVPDSVGDRIEERVEAMPSAAPLVAGYFGFAGKLLDAQREFVGELVEVFQPAPKKAAKQAASKKAASKGAKKAA